MNERSRRALLSRGGVFCVAAVLLAACGGEQEQTYTPTPPPPKPWKAENLQGPFKDVADFCARLGAATCDERAGAVTVFPPDPFKPMTSGDGSTVQLFVVVSSDPKKQRTHFLIARNGELFALPPAAEYDAADGKRHEVVLRAFDEDRKS